MAADSVLVAIIVTIAILAFGSITVLVILLVIKWRDFWKRRQNGRIQVVSASRSQSRHQSQRSRHRRTDGNQENQTNSPPPYVEFDLPPVYTPADLGTPQMPRRGNHNPVSQGEQDDYTIAYSPPPPYTVLPPRNLITRESVQGSSRNTIASLQHIGPETTNNTPFTSLLTPAGNLFASMVDCRQASASSATRQMINTRQASGSSGSRQQLTGSQPIASDSHVRSNRVRRLRQQVAASSNRNHSRILHV